MSSVIKMLAVLGLFLLAYAEPIELINNGDFENPLTTGWQQDINNVRGSSEIIRDVGYDADQDYEARVYKDQSNSAALFQTISMPSLDLEFKADYCFSAVASDAQVQGVAAISVEYLDSQGKTLGKSIFYASAPADMLSSDAVTAAYPVEMGAWANRSFNIQNALADLPGLNADLIAQIKVSLLTQGQYKRVNCST